MGKLGIQPGKVSCKLKGGEHLNKSMNPGKHGRIQKQVRRHVEIILLQPRWLLYLSEEEQQAEDGRASQQEHRGLLGDILIQGEQREQTP